MAEISRFLFLRHLRGEASRHLVQYADGKQVRSGRGLSFWFAPWSASISELPVDDQEFTVVVTGRSRDFQQVTTQGVLFWRIADPALLASRLDFSIDLQTGAWKMQPMEQIHQLLSELAQQICWSYVAHTDLERVLEEGVETLSDRLAEGLSGHASLEQLGIVLVSTSIRAIRPLAEVEKALMTTTREKIQQAADKATYERRAMAVERERAIEENELKNKIELARQEEELIAQEAQNERRRITEEVETRRLEAEAKAERAAIQATTEADAIRLVEGARADTEAQQVAIYADLPSEVLLGLAAQKVAGNLPPVEHLTLSPELIGPALARLAGRVGS